jgi:hypothetical protein
LGGAVDTVNRGTGYQRREWDTHAGTVELAIPKLRSDSDYPPPPTTRPGCCSLGAKRPAPSRSMTRCAAGPPTEEGHLIQLEAPERNAAYVIAQELMITANEAAARWCASREVQPLLYRTTAPTPWLYPRSPPAGPHGPAASPPATRTSERPSLLSWGLALALVLAGLLRADRTPYQRHY